MHDGRKHSHICSNFDARITFALLETGNLYIKANFTVLAIKLNKLCSY